MERDLRRLEIAWVRLYCVLVPKPYRRTWLRHTLDYGLLGPMLWVPMAVLWRPVEWIVARIVAKMPQMPPVTHE